MSPTPASGGNAADPKACDDCARESSSRFPSSSVVPRETHCLTYVLDEIPAWLSRGWICDDCADALADACRCQRDRMLFGIPHTSQAPAAVAATSAPVAPSSAPSGTTRPTSSGGLLEAASMKLVALLAALFIFAGMRQILGVRWSGGAALIPLLPLAVATLLYYFGLRASRAGSLGGYAYCGVAIVLSAFCVFSVNEHWLGERLGQPAALLAAFAVSTALSARTLRATADAAHIHLLIGGLAATLNAALQLLAPSPWIAPSPLLVYGGAHLALALGLILTARRADGASPMLHGWALAVGATGLLRALLAVLAGRGGALELGALVLLAAGSCAVVSIRHPRAALAYAASGGAVVGVALMLAGAGIAGWYSLGLAALMLAGTAFLLARAAGEGVLRVDYERAGFMLAGGAGLAIAGRILAYVARFAEGPAAQDWALGALLGALSAALYARLARAYIRYDGFYAAAASASFAVAIASHRLFLTLQPNGVLLALDLLAVAALALAASTVLQRKLSSADPGRGSAFQATSAAAVISGVGSVLVALVGALWSGPAWPFWAATVGVLVLATVGVGLLSHEDAGAYRAAWGAVLVASTAAGVAFLGPRLAATTNLPAAIAAGAGLALLAWFWLGVAEAVHGSVGRTADTMRSCAAGTGVIGAAISAVSAESAAGWMSAVFALSMAQLVVIGVRRASIAHIAGSLAIVGLCPLRLAPAALDTHGTAPPAVLAAVIFALCAASVYGLAAWRMQRPGIIWLAAAAIAIAGGGGVLFGAPSPLLARVIGVTAGAGMIAGAVGLGIAAAWSQRRTPAYAAGLLLLAGYARFATIVWPVSREWLGMEMLPAPLLLVALSHYREGTIGAVLHQPLQRAGLAAAYLGLPVLSAAAVAAGPAAYFSLAVTLFCYALLFGASALAGAELDHPSGVLSTAALLAGWLFGLNVAGGVRAEVADGLLVAVTALCAMLYGRIAVRLSQQPPAYGAALAGCCAWVALAARVFHTPDTLWAAAALPFLVLLSLAGERMRGGRLDALAMPLRQIAFGFGLLALLWSAGSAIYHGLDATAGRAAATACLFGAAYALGALRLRERPWVTAAAGSLSLAWAFAATAFAPTAEPWAAVTAPLALVWLGLAWFLSQDEGVQPLARPLYGLATFISIATALAALPVIETGVQVAQATVTFLVAGGAQLGVFLAGRGPVHAHTAFALLVPVYYLLLKQAAHLDGSFADLYLLPAGLYLLFAAHLAARRRAEALAWALRWAGLLMLLTPSFAGFYAAYTTHGTPAHTLLLLLECTLLVAAGVARGVRPFVQAGALSALAFVGVTAFSAAEAWTGLFSAALGIALLAAVFYLSVHPDAVRRWTGRPSLNTAGEPAASPLGDEGDAIAPPPIAQQAEREGGESRPQSTNTHGLQSRGPHTPGWTA